MAIVNRKDFLEELKKVVKIIPNSATISTIKGALIEIENSNMIISATNLSTSIITNVVCDANMIKEDYIIDAKLVYNIVSKLKSDTIEIDYDINKNSVIIKGGKSSKFSLAVIGSKNDFPSIDTMISIDKNNNEISIPGYEFKKLVASTVPFTSSDESRPVLEGVRLEFSENQLLGVSLDGYRLSHNVTNINNKSKAEFLVSGSALTNIAKTLQDESTVTIHYVEESKNICFSIGNTSIYTKELSGTYFDYKNLLKTDYKTVIRVNTKDILGAIDRVSIIANSVNASNPIIIEVKDKKIHFTSKNEIGKVNETVEYNELEGEISDFKIAFNHRYLIEGLKVATEEEINIKLNGPLNPAFLTDEVGFTYMVLPIRLMNSDE